MSSYTISAYADSGNKLSSEPRGLTRVTKHPEILIKILEQALVSSQPIINPWMRHNLDEDDHYYHAYSWNIGLNIDVLVICKLFYYEGIKLLYRQNRFRFTRITPSLTVIPEYEGNLGIRIQTFLNKKHHLYHPEFPEVVTRGQLIARVILQDSDSDCDKLAAEGYSKSLLSLEENTKQWDWMFGAVRRLVLSGCKLNTLTITFDSQAPGALDYLQHISSQSGSWPSPSQNYHFQFDFFAHSSILSHKVTTMQPILSQTSSQINTISTGIITKILQVRGSISLEDDSRRIKPTGALAAGYIQRWLVNRGIGVTFPIKFSGEFTNRSLLPDGTKAE